MIQLFGQLNKAGNGECKPKWAEGLGEYFEVVWGAGVSLVRPHAQVTMADKGLTQAIWGAIFTDLWSQVEVWFHTDNVLYRSRVTTTVHVDVGFTQASVSAPPLHFEFS